MSELLSWRPTLLLEHIHQHTGINSPADIQHEACGYSCVLRDCFRGIRGYVQSSGTYCKEGCQHQDEYIEATKTGYSKQTQRRSEIPGFPLSRYTEMRTLEPVFNRPTLFARYQVQQAWIIRHGRRWRRNTCLGKNLNSCRRNI